MPQQGIFSTVCPGTAERFHLGLVLPADLSYLQPSLHKILEFGAKHVRPQQHRENALMRYVIPKHTRGVSTSRFRFSLAANEIVALRST
jgi:hypothetical protein